MSEEPIAAAGSIVIEIMASEFELTIEDHMFFFSPYVEPYGEKPTMTLAL